MRAEPPIPSRISPHIAKLPEKRPLEGRAFAQIHPRRPQKHFRRVCSVTQATATNYVFMDLLHQMQHAKRVGQSRVACARVGKVTNAQLMNPTQPLNFRTV